MDKRVLLEYLTSNEKKGAWQYFYDFYKTKHPHASHQEIKKYADDELKKYIKKYGGKPTKNDNKILKNNKDDGVKVSGSFF